MGIGPKSMPVKFVINFIEHVYGKTDGQNNTGNFFDAAPENMQC